MGTHYEPQSGKQPDPIEQLNNTATMLWIALVNSLIQSEVIERYALVDNLTAVLEQMGDDANGLPRRLAEDMKKELLKGVEPTPEIDPSTRATLDEIKKKAG